MGAVSAGAAAATGLLVAIVMMLNYAIRNLVGVFIPGMDSDLVEEPAGAHAGRREPVGASR